MKKLLALSLVAGLLAGCSDYVKVLEYGVKVCDGLDESSGIVDATAGIVGDDASGVVTDIREDRQKFCEAVRARYAEIPEVPVILPEAEE